MKLDKIKSNSIKFYFIILLISISSPSIHLLGQNNKSNTSIVTDTSLQIKRINTFSLILEVGKSNIFNSMGTVYRDGYLYNTQIARDYKSIIGLFDINVIGGLAYSVGITFNHKMNTLSQKIFKRNPKSLILFKNELVFNSLNFKGSVTQNIPIVNPYRLQFDDKLYYDNKQLEVQMFQYSPSIELLKNLSGKKYVLLDFGPEVLVLNDYHRKIITFYDFVAMKFAFGGHIAVGTKYKNTSFKLKYHTFSIAPINPFFNTSNESFFNNYYKKTRFESLNLSTEFTF